MVEIKKNKTSEKVNKEPQAHTKDDAKMKELKIELLKQGSKKRDIKREIARILTLQQNKMETKK